MTRSDRATAPYDASWSESIALQLARLRAEMVDSRLSRLLSRLLDRELKAHASASHLGLVIPVSGDATIPHLQQVWREISKEWTREQSCILDLSDCSFYDVAGMAYIVSRLVERRQHGMHTAIRLPEHPEMINFLREFAFPEALAAALDTPLPELVTTDSLLRLALPDARPTEKVVLNSWPTLPFNYFPLEVVPLGRSTRHGPAVQYAATWLSRHVLSALDRDLAGQGTDVAQRVVLETLMAASVGREERMGLVAAHYGLRREAGPCLEIAFWWDDGAGNPHEPQSDAASRAKSAANTSRPSVMESDATEVLNIAAESPNAALATLQAIDENPAAHLPLDGGLTVLGTAVTEIFHGRLDVYRKSIHFVLDARRQSDGGRSEPFPEVAFNQSEGAEFFGNLIVVTLPFAG